MSAPLKILSLNIERSKHLDLVEPFLAAHRPEVACIQELYENDIPKLSQALDGAPCVFTPMARHIRETPPKIMGIGIFSTFPVRESGMQFYRGDPAHIPDLDQDDPKTWNNKNFLLLRCDVEKGGDIFRIATTHFTWTPDGEPNDLQREDMKKLLPILNSLGEFVLAGDFNAPRGLPGQGGEIFEMLAKRFKDNIPTRYTTSIDGALHRNGPLELMVDGLFSTPGFVVSDVEMISGVSDHCALIATVSKTS